MVRMRLSERENLKDYLKEMPDTIETCMKYDVKHLKSYILSCITCLQGKSFKNSLNINTFLSEAINNLLKCK